VEQLWRLYSNQSNLALAMAFVTPDQATLLKMLFAVDGKRPHDALHFPRD